MSLSKYPKVYRGGEGAKVVLIPLSPKSEKKALIEVSGIDTEIDTKVYLYDLKQTGRDGEAYFMQYDGEDTMRIKVSKGYWSKWVTLYLPDANDGIQVYYDEQESKKIVPSTYAKRYDKNKKSQAEIAKFNRKKSRDYNEEKFAEILADTNKDCGKNFKASIDWKSVSDKIIKDYSVYSYCSRHLEAAARFCRKSPENKKKFNDRVDSFACKFGKKIRARLNGKTFDWTAETEQGNQGDFAKAFIINNF